MSEGRGGAVEKEVRIMINAEILTESFFPLYR